MDIVSEIMVVSRNQIFVEKSGVVEDSRRAFFSDELLMAIIERIVAPVGRRIDRQRARDLNRYKTAGLCCYA